MNTTTQTTAYWLVQTTPGTADDVALALREIDGVAEAAVVQGPYDVIVRQQASESSSDIRQMLAAIAGVMRILPCHIIPTEPGPIDDGTTRTVSLDEAMGIPA